MKEKHVDLLAFFVGVIFLIVSCLFWSLKMTFPFMSFGFRLFDLFFFMTFTVSVFSFIFVLVKLIIKTVEFLKKRGIW